jgi:hypothetical protein
MLLHQVLNGEFGLPTCSEAAGDRLHHDLSLSCAHCLAFAAASFATGCAPLGFHLEGIAA